MIIYIYHYINDRFYFGGRTRGEPLFIYPEAARSAVNYYKINIRTLFTGMFPPPAFGFRLPVSDSPSSLVEYVI